MNIKLGIKKKKKILEYIKWFFIVVLVFSLFLENCFFNYNIWYLHILFLLLIVFVLFLIFVYTDKGKKIICFFRESKLEMYKVVWPSYQKIFYTTLVVLVVTFILSLILWGLDTVCIYLVSFFTELRF